MKEKLSFQELISRKEPTLVDFSAEWCGPCQAMGPILKEVATTIGDKATIIKIDVDKNGALADQLEIRNVPTFILYKDGKIVWRQSGMQSAYALTEMINQNL